MLNVIAHGVVGDIRASLDKHGEYTWGDTEDTICGPLVLFDDDESAGVLDVKRVYVEDDEVCIYGIVRETKEPYTAYLENLNTDDKILLLEYLPLAD